MSKSQLASDLEAFAQSAMYRYHILVRQNGTGGLKTMTALGPEETDLKVGADIAFVMKDRDGTEGVFEGTVVRVDRERLRHDT